MCPGLQAVVFDLDGTLIDTAADLHLVLTEVLAEESLEAPSLDVVRGLIGDGAKVLIERALVAVGVTPGANLVGRLFARFRARYAEEPCRASTLYPGCRELLVALESARLCLGLCTNKPQAATMGLLAALGVDRTFASVIGGDALPVRKPDPAHLAAVIAELDATAATTVMVGDSRNDVATAQGQSVPIILVSFGYTSVPARDLGAAAVIDHLLDLPGALEGLTRSGPLPS